MGQVGDYFQDILGNEVLTQVTHYSLHRDEGAFDLYVHGSVSGPRVGEYLAIPRMALSFAAGGYHGRGRSEQDALKDCLQETQGIPFEAIFRHEVREDARSGNQQHLG